MTGLPLDATAPADPARRPGSGRRGGGARRRGGALVPAVSLATVMAVLGLWVAATRAGWVKPLFLPAPEAILSAFVQAWTGTIDGAPLGLHVRDSLLRVTGAFGLAALLEIPAGLAMGTNRIARGILDPLIEFYRPLPPLAYLPLMVIWFGIGELSKVLLILLACFAPVALSTRAGVLAASRDQIHAARALGASRAQVLRHVVVPAAMPEILIGLRIGMGVGWTTLVAAEMVAAQAGLRQPVLNASNFLRTDGAVMGILVIGLFATLFECGLRWLERVLVPWKGQS
ncbi:ABC transporter permease subunit [Methylobacterium sp. PvR107]|uniref:ABC transporter permease subunit n=1 Tax=Methylobacterium sp. PvR107 TaxID=2806597 RepID=UPI001AE8ABCD|nr:ABC transporter permease subunit [Methylobacterium sp. PvR107]MBP1178314.1 taurine transport system permease protein [Methylobacterium sp. PvR107]